jgi:hypothetical protein
MISADAAFGLLSQVLRLVYPCRTYFGFKLTSLGLVLGGLLFGVNPSFEWSDRTLKFAVPGPGPEAVAAAVVALIVLAAFDGILELRRQRLRRYLAQLLADPGISESLKQRLLDEVIRS